MNILCSTISKINVPLITITENISSYIDYYEELRIIEKLPSFIKKQYKHKYSSIRNLYLNPENNKLKF